MAKKDSVADVKSERTKALSQAIASIEKRFGKGSIMRLGEDEAIDVPVIPTGAIALDYALGIGGYPLGRIVEIYGPESSGKTTLTLHAMAEVQRQGGVAAFIDAEHALDVRYARALGVKTEDLIIAQPDYGEQALEIAETLASSNAVDLIVIDSVAALVPKAEIDGEMGDNQVGLQARLMSKAMRKLTAIVSKSNTCVLLTNQIRMKIGVMYGNPEVTTGGNALKFYSSIRMEVRRIGSIKKGDQILGNRVRVKVVKNKMAPPFREAEFDIIYGEGFNKEGMVIDMAVNAGIVERAGAWYSYGSVRLGQGMDNVKAYLKENPEMFKEIEQKVREHYGFAKKDVDEEAKDESSAT